MPQAVVHVFERFLCRSGQVVASSKQRSQSGGDSVTRTQKLLVKQLKLAAGQHGFGAGQHVIQVIAGQRDARDQNKRHIMRFSRLGNIARAGWAAAVPIGQQPSRQRSVVAYQHGGLRQHQLGKGIHVLFQRIAFLPPRQIGHVADDGDVRVVAAKLGNAAEIGGRASKSQLDGRHRHVFEDGARLVGNQLIVQGRVAEHPAGVADIHPTGHRHRVRAHTGDGHHVNAQPPAATGIQGVETHHTQRMVCAGISGVVAVGRGWRS